MQNTRRNSVKKNFIMNFFIQGSAYILPFFLTPYISRILMPEGMGKISFCTSILTYLMLISMLGIPTYGIRACSGIVNDRDKLSQTVQEIFLINVVMTVFAYICLWLLVKFVPSFSASSTLFKWMSIGILLNTLGLDWVYKSYEEYTTLAIRSFIAKILVIVAVFLFVKKEEDILLYGLLTMFASYGANLINFINSYKLVDWKPRKKYEFKKHLHAIFIFFSMTVAITIYTNLDIVMLKLMSNDVQVGLYDASIKVKTLLLGVVSSLGAVLLPRVCAYIAEEQYDRFRNLCERALNVIFLITIPLVTYFILFSQETIYCLSGEAFLDAVPAMRILMLTLIFIGITNITGTQMLVPLGNEQWVLYSEIAGAIIDVIINFCLIPRYGIVGAAIGTLVAEIAVFAVQIYACREYALSILKGIKYYKPLCATFISTALVLGIHLLKINILLKLLISFSCFFICYALLLILFKEEETVSLIKNALNLLKRGKPNE